MGEREEKNKVIMSQKTSTQQVWPKVGIIDTDSRYALDYYPLHYYTLETKILDFFQKINK